MKQGYIKIQESAEGRFTINANLHNGNIWLTKHEIANLFEVFVSSVSSKLKTLFKKGLLEEEKVKKNTLVKTSKANYKTYVDLYNIEAITMLSYHLEGKKAQVFRQWTQKIMSQYIQEEKQANLLHSMLFYDRSEVN